MHPLELPSEKKWIDRPVDETFLFLFVSEYGTRVQITLSYFLLYMLNRFAYTKQQKIIIITKENSL